MHKIKNRAFSLVELSIVLVILGLLVGGILAGQSLIRASELRVVGTEYQRYVTAIGAFRDKYFALPGDMGNAQSVWGVAAACPGTSATPSTSAATCNGDGSGLLSRSAATANELYRFWHHLANAGLVEGTYSGVANSTTGTDQYSLVGTNVPASKLGNSNGWTPVGVGSATLANPTWFEGSYGNILVFGGQITNNITQNGTLTPTEAWNIDTKLDDGKPGTGTVLTFEWAGPTTCHNATASTTVETAASAAYLLNSATVGCAMLFKTGY